MDKLYVITLHMEGEEADVFGVFYSQQMAEEVFGDRWAENEPDEPAPVWEEGHFEGQWDFEAFDGAYWAQMQEMELNVPLSAKPRPGWGGINLTLPPEVEIGPPMTIPESMTIHELGEQLVAIMPSDWDPATVRDLANKATEMLDLNDHPHPKENKDG